MTADRELPDRLPGKAERLVALLANAQMVLTGIFLILMMLHVTLDVAVKYFFNAPIIGTLETVSYYYMVSVVFLPLAMIELRNEHVSVDLLFRKFPAKLQMAVFLFGAALGLIYYGMLTWQTLLDALKATDQRETVMANFLFYVWPSRWALPIGMGSLMLAIAVNAAKAAVTGIIPEPDSEQEGI
jgi:TRAP-type C4-dicarboxylate transport system permease small subunit